MEPNEMTVGDQIFDREEAIRLRARAIWERAGRPEGKDVEHWRQAEEEEVAAEQRFRLVVEAAPNAMVMIDRAGEIVMVNAQTERIFGYSRAELLGQPVEMLVPPRVRGHHSGLREAFSAHPQARPMGAGRDLFGLRKDGSEFPVEIGLNPIETDEGLMVLSAIVDVSERKAAEAALRESQERAQALHAELLHVSRLSAMGQMGAMVAHELNQPLTAIRNYMEAAGALLRRGGDSPRLSTAIERAAEQAMRAAQIVQQVRGFASRGDAEKRLEAIPTLLREAAELALVGTRQHGVAIRVDGNLADVCVLVDRIQMQQVLFNLLRNAAEAVADQEYRDVALLAEAADNTVRISVVDNGPGLPEEVKAKLFQPFVSTKRTGMGVGLSICHSIVTAHNGRIWADANPGGGTIFNLALPIASACDPADA
jgi:two-component system, LuxR family, sensor kinase FixL